MITGIQTMDLKTHAETVKVDHGIPENIYLALKRYWNDALPPGAFVTAVLSNNLMDAVGYADHVSERYLADIVNYVKYHSPRGSYGNPELVRSWLQRDDNYVQYQKQRTWEALSQ